MSEIGIGTDADRNVHTVLLIPGMRLSSVTCTTQVLVIAAGAGTLTCGGKPMAKSLDASTPLQLRSSRGESIGTLLGKRYRSKDGGCVVLCVRHGQGTLELDGVPLELIKPKILPASD